MSKPFPPNLYRYSPAGFLRGRSAFIESLWMIVQWLVISSPIPGSVQRACVLRLFGAKLGKNVVIKPGVRVKFPWRLEVGENSWLGEDVWIDNLVEVKIGANCCVSQGAYLCTGSHNWSFSTFDLITKSITLEDGAWVAAQAIVGPGVLIGEGAVLSLGAVATNHLKPWTINSGNPAEYIKPRTISTVTTSRSR